MKITSFQKKLRKAGRIASEQEKLNVERTKKDVGHIKKFQYSKKAQRLIPKALHRMYGLPMRDRKRTENEQVLFMVSLKNKK